MPFCLCDHFPSIIFHLTLWITKTILEITEIFLKNEGHV